MSRVMSIQPEDRSSGVSVSGVSSSSSTLSNVIIRHSTSGYHHHNTSGTTLLSRSLASYPDHTLQHPSRSYQPSEASIDQARSSSSSYYNPLSSDHNITLSFPSTSDDIKQSTSLNSIPIDLVAIFETAFHCYEALDYNQMIFVLKSVKITPEMSPSQILSIHFGLGLGHYKQSAYDSAVLNLLKAETIAKEEDETKRGSGNLCLVSYYLGEVEYMQNKFLPAASYFETSIKKYNPKSVGERYGVRVPPLYTLYCKCGTCLRYASKVMEAIKSYKKGVELSRTASNLDGELSARTSLGNLYQSLGEFKKAVDEYHETLILAEKLEDYVSLGWAHGNIGNAYLGMSKREKALHHLELAFSITLQHEPVPQAIGRAYNNLGTVYQSLNELDKAKEHYELALNQAIYGNDLPGQARVYGNLGNLLMLQCKYTEAIVHYTETLTISRDRATHITAYHNRGCARFERAENERKCYLEEGLDNVELLTGKKSNLVFIGTDVSDCEEEHKFLSLPDYLQKYYRDSQSDLERVVKHHEQTFQDIKGSQRGLSLSVSLFETNMKTFQRLQDCSFFLDQWQQALVYAEQSRARTLGELLLGKHSSRLKSSFRTPLDLPQVISIVKEQTLPVVYITYTGSRLLTWVLTPLNETTESTNDFSINLFQATLDSSQFQGKSFDFLVRSLLSESLIEKQVNMYDICDYNQNTLLNDLHELIAKPLLRLLKSVYSPEKLSNIKDVLYIADSHTNLIPIATLQDSSTREFLGDQLRFHTMHSLLTLGIVQQLPTSIVNIPLDSSNMCIVGNPSTPTFKYQGNTWNLGRLPYAEEEAQRIAHTLQTTPILGTEALKDVILTKINQAKVVHLATHGSALSGFLIFAGSTRLSLTDEDFTKSILLFTEDLEKLTIPAALVVLSSCDSGRGIVKVDGIQGIARSFLLAGAQAVLTSLWRVPDESASFFMHFFYRYLVDGLSSFKALQKAAHSIRCYSKYSGYIHWSGYQLQGREIQFDSTNSHETKRLQKILGGVNVFPQLKEILKMKRSLFVDSKYVPSPAENISVRNREDRQLKIQRAMLYPQRADVQLLIGAMGTRPQEVVIDYIASTHTHYTGGIYWIPGHCNDIALATLQHVQELLCDSSHDRMDVTLQPLSDHFSSFDDPVLLVLDSFNSLPLSYSSPLKTLMLKTNVQIILTSHKSSLTDKLKEDSHRYLTRGLIVHELKPLHCLSALQRLIYNVLSVHELVPKNKEQKIFDIMEVFVGGQPDLVNISCALLNHCIEESVSPSEGLATFEEKVIQETSKEIDKVFDMEEMENTQNLTEAKLLTAKHDAYTTTDSTDDDRMHSKPSIIYTRVLIQFAQLDYWEYLFLYCLSSLYSIPIHSSVLEALENTLNFYRENKDLEIMDLMSHLKAFKFITLYPHPVIQMSSNNSKDQPSTTQYFILSPVVCETIQLNLTEQDKFISCSLLYHTLNDLSSSLNNTSQSNSGETNSVSSFLILHCIALRGALLLNIAQEEDLFGKDILVDIMDRCITEKYNLKGREGLAELIPEISF